MTRQRAFLMAVLTFVAGVALGATVVALERPTPATTASLTSTPSPSLSPARSPSTSPSARFWPSMAFDAADEKVVLFGGSGSNDVGLLPGTVTTLLAETWTWSRAGWRQEHPAVSPPARRAAAMVYDPSSRHVLLWGGELANGPAADFWNWDGSSWSQIRVTDGPPPDNNLGWPFPAPVLIWDSSRNVVELIRNNGAHPAAPAKPDVWYWDESKWTQASGEGAPMAWGTAAFDARSGQTVFYAATPTVQPQTYTYDLKGWTPTAPVVAPPIQLDNPPPLVFFAPTGHTLAVEPNGDVWSFDGVDWTQTGTGTFPVLNNYAITYDTELRAIVLYGGSRTWSWDGTSWTEL